MRSGTQICGSHMAGCAMQVPLLIAPAARRGAAASFLRPSLSSRRGRGGRGSIIRVLQKGRHHGMRLGGARP